MSIDFSFSSIRRSYGNMSSLSLKEVPDDPILLFKQWFSELPLADIPDPTAMTLSTVDEFGCPDARIVLLKDLSDVGFTFFTHYQSEKGRQMAKNSNVSLTFYWPCFARQVRVRGTVQKLSEDASTAYFLTRPLMSQLSAIVSNQSESIPNRDYLLKKLAALQNTVTPDTITKPEGWGGYSVQPNIIEFWQGRDDRLHDRLQYKKDGPNWKKVMLAP
jgi:pyridoxamine 5'-phosphate oxidase